MTIAKRLYTGVMPDKTASRLIKRIKKQAKQGFACFFAIAEVIL